MKITSAALLVVLTRVAYAAELAIEGRWRAATANGKAIAALDITRCGEELCGRSVDPEGACGPIVLRLSTEQGTSQQWSGRLQAGERTFDAYASRTTQDTLNIWGHEKGSVSIRSMPLLQGLVADGVALCADKPAS